MKILIMIFLMNQNAFARDLQTIEFIKRFIENEGKPTDLVYGNLCWGKKLQVNLAREVSKAGYLSTSSLQTEFKYKIHSTLFLLDLSCPGSQEVFGNIRTKNLFAYGYRWLLLSDSDDLSAVRDEPIWADSDVVLAKRTEDGYVMTEIHRPSNISSLVLNPKGYYDGTLVDVRPDRELFRRRRNMMGSPITMANVIQDSNKTQYHLPRETRLELQYDVAARVCWMYARLAFEMLNATPRHIFSYRWGYKQNGRWSGMINDLYENNADLGSNCLPDAQRFDVVTSTDVLAPFKVRFIFRQPPLSYSSNIFSLPFSSNVWVATAVCAAMTTVFFFITGKWEAKSNGNATQIAGFGDALLLTMSAVGQQGCVLDPRKLSGRIMLFAFFTALMALYAAYSANIVVLLQAPSNSIRTLPQLASSKITLAAIDLDYSHFILKFFSSQNDAVRTEIKKRIDPDKGKRHFYGMNDGVERIRQGLFAFHSIAEPVYRRIEQTFQEAEKCDLVEVDFLNGFDPYVPVRKQSPYLELLKVTFKQIRESGLRSAINQRMQTPKPRCSSKQAAFSSVGLLDLRPVLLLMVYGAALSVAILLVEIAVDKLYKSLNFTRQNIEYNN